MKKIMKKALISGILLGTIGSNQMVKADFHSTSGIATCKYEVFAYDRDSFDSERIGIIDANKDVYRILSGENCDLVSSGDLLFFVEKDALERKMEFSSDTNYYPLQFDGVTTKKVNLRVGPSTDQNIITTMDEDSFIEIIGVSDNGWYLVDYNNVLGFVSSDYVKEIHFNEIEEKITTLPRIDKIVESTSEVNVRKGPSTDYEILGTVPKGFKMFLNQRFDNGWCEVEKNGHIGYVCGDYLKEKYIIDGECLKLVSLNNNSDLYESPYKNVIDTIPQFEVCYVYGEIDDFYYVECNGNVGFVKKKDCKKLHNTYVVVDISDQEMTVYQGTDVILKSDVVTGKDITPTSIGMFSILSKESPRELIGEDYDVWVDYWMRFYEGQGLHDLNRSAYGGEIYHNKGSHGCINLPKKVAKKLYGIVSVGDQVLVKR